MLLHTCLFSSNWCAYEACCHGTTALPRNKDIGSTRCGDGSRTLVVFATATPPCFAARLGLHHLTGQRVID